jgi:hypothetical protein
MFSSCAGSELRQSYRYLTPAHLTWPLRHRQVRRSKRPKHTSDFDQCVPGQELCLPMSNAEGGVDPLIAPMALPPRSSPLPQAPRGLLVLIRTA